MARYDLVEMLGDETLDFTSDLQRNNQKQIFCKILNGTFNLQRKKFTLIFLISSSSWMSRIEIEMIQLRFFSTRECTLSLSNNLSAITIGIFYVSIGMMSAQCPVSAWEEVTNQMTALCLDQRELDCLINQEYFLQSHQQIPSPRRWTYFIELI